MRVESIVTVHGTIRSSDMIHFLLAVFKRNANIDYQTTELNQVHIYIGY